MNGKIPHLVQYQGSKRKLAPQILQYMPKHIKRFIEPFAGMAAMSIATAYEKRAEQYYINDLNRPLVDLLKEVVECPIKLFNDYNEVWSEQFKYGENHVQHFYDVRERFNNGEKKPANMLYLLARCVKGSVRYGKNGNFNQSPDKRRHGTTPKNIESNVYLISNLLKGKTVFTSCDYKSVFNEVKYGDLIYMDPPYQGVSSRRDNRYFSGVSFEEFSKSLEILNEKGVDYLISYDGECGGKEYGEDLPNSLGCKKIMLNAGVSTQATLQGKSSITFEALYVSKSLIPYLNRSDLQLLLF